MARLLVFTAVLVDHPRPEMRAHQYKPGMIISIIEDGQAFGALDVGPHSRVIEMPGIPASDLSDLHKPQESIEIAQIGGQPTRVRKLLGLRKFRAVNIAALPGTIALARGQVAAFIAGNFAPEPAPLGPIIQ